MVEMDAAHDWLERPGEAVRPKLRGARIATELVIHASVAGALAGQRIDELAHAARRDYLVVGHASER
jgi:hypothetical protein